MKWAAFGMLLLAVVTAFFIFGGTSRSDISFHVIRATHFVKMLSFAVQKQDVLTEGWPLAEDPALVISTILSEVRAGFERHCTAGSSRLDLLHSLTRVEDLLCGDTGFFAEVFMQRYAREKMHRDNPFQSFVVDLKAEYAKIRRFSDLLTFEEKKQLAVGSFMNLIGSLERLCGSFIDLWEDGYSCNGKVEE